MQGNYDDIYFDREVNPQLREKRIGDARTAAGDSGAGESRVQWKPAVEFAAGSIGPISIIIICYCMSLIIERMLVMTIKWCGIIIYYFIIGIGMNWKKL